MNPPQTGRTVNLSQTGRTVNPPQIGRTVNTPTGTPNLNESSTDGTESRPQNW